jgi:hypothetical protein
MTSPARTTFVDHMNALLEAASFESLVSNTPVAGKRDPARFLRNGLAVVGYSAFETFITDRSSEILTDLNSEKLAFGKLPDKLKEAATLGAVKAISHRASYEEISARLSFVQRHAQYIASTATGGYTFSSLTFSPQSTNLTVEDIERFLRALVVDAPWTELTEIARRAGYATLGFRDHMKQLLLQRNEAAHTVDADVEITDLRQMPFDLLAAGLSFDALASRAVRAITERGAQVDCNAKLQKLSQMIRIIFVDEKPGASRRYREYGESSQRATKVYTEFDIAISEASTRAASQRSVLVIRDVAQRPIDWRV